MKLKGKIAIVTGAARGLGKEIALGLAREGSDVAICDVNKEALDQTVNDLEEIKLTDSPVSKNIVLFQVESLPPFIGGRHVCFGCFGNLPILHFSCVVRH